MARVRTQRAALLAAVLAGAGLLSACAPLLLGGAVVGGSLMAADRRSSGAQIEDEAIELKAGSRLRDALGDRGHVEVTSFNRVVLITGQVPTDADKATVARIVGQVENVRSVVTEIAVRPASTWTGRSADTILTGRVKAALLDVNDTLASDVKVVSERGTVYLMGRVTPREADKASEAARSVGSVNKVVRVFEIISEAEVPKKAVPAKAPPQGQASQ